MNLVMTALFFALAAGTPPPPKQHMVSVAIKSGNPYGSEGAGTIEVLSRPSLMLAEKQPGVSEFGQPVTVNGVHMATKGLVVRARVETIGNGKLGLNGSVEIYKTEMADASRSVMTRRDSTSTTFRHEVYAGETVRVLIRKDLLTETWAELTVNAVDSMPVATILPRPAPKPRGSMTVSLGYHAGKGLVVDVRSNTLQATPAVATVAERAKFAYEASSAQLMPFAVTRVVAPQPVFFVPGMPTPPVATERTMKVYTNPSYFFAPQPAGYTHGWGESNPSRFATRQVIIVQPGVELRSAGLTMPAVPATPLKTLTGQPVPAASEATQWPVFATPNK